MRIAVMILLAAAWAVPAKCQQGGPTKAEYAQARETKKAEPSAPVLKSHEEAVSRQATSDGKEKAERAGDPAHDWIDWLNAFSTLVMAVFTILVAVFIGRQVRTTRSIERAWMTGSPRFKNFEGPPEPGQGLLYACSLKNVGRTPARILETALAVRKADSLAVIPVEPRYVGPEQLSINRPVIAPNDSFMITAAAASFTPEDYVALKNRKLVLYAYGYVKYTDVFGRYRETRFCHYYRIPGIQEAQGEGFQLCVEAPKSYNRAT
jgi:hypothetical protein